MTACTALLSQLLGPVRRFKAILSISAVLAFTHKIVTSTLFRFTDWPLLALSLLLPLALLTIAALDRHGAPSSFCFQCARSHVSLRSLAAIAAAHGGLRRAELPSTGGACCGSPAISDLQLSGVPLRRSYRTDDSSGKTQIAKTTSKQAQGGNRKRSRGQDLITHRNHTMMRAVRACTGRAARAALAHPGIAAARPRVTSSRISITPRPSLAACVPAVSHRRTFASSSSPLSLSPREKSVLRSLQSIRLPSSPSGEGQDIVYSGHVRSVTEKDGVVTVVLPLDDHYRTLKKTVQELLDSPSTRAKLEWIRGARVVMESKEASAAGTRSAAAGGAAKPDGLSQVQHIIAVSSCKGGVGKSSVAVNLAYALQSLQTTDPLTGLSRDLRVGILDADIYGPSLPTMVSPRDSTLRYNDASPPRIVPPTYLGVKTMSYGYVAASQKSKISEKTPAGTSADADTDAHAMQGAFIRGPLASAAVKQLATETAWGELDYLIVDFPPGTGDIQLTLTQSLRVRAAVVVTTPSRLSFIDVLKGVQLFLRTRIPVLAVVENMSYFLCGNCDTKHRIFGEQGAKYLSQLTRRYGEIKLLEIPLVPELSKSNDEGTPFVMGHDPSPEVAMVRGLYHELAESVHRDCSDPRGKLRATPPQLRFDAATGCCVLEDAPAAVAATLNAAADAAVTAAPSPPAAAAAVSIPARLMRLSCQCAGCVDELSGARRLDPARVPADVRPLGMQPRGNYAVAIHWSDGHASSIYPFTTIRALAESQHKAGDPAAPASV